MIWELNFVQPCVPVDLLISITLMVMLLPLLLPAKIGALWSWRTMTADVLLALLPRRIFPTINTDPNGYFMP